jgi:hypothetical protein
MVQKFLYLITITIYGSLSKYMHFFLFIFWWHQICSFPFCFSLLVFPTLQWHIHIICSRENLHANIVTKMVLQRKYPKLCIMYLYIMYVTTFYIQIIFHFPKKNNFMLINAATKISRCRIQFISPIPTA